MDRGKYNKCIKEKMSGRTLTKDERKLEFCVAAKTCSGKTKDREEAVRICSLPKPPKEKKQKAKGKTPFETCEKEAFALSHCMAERIDMNMASNVNSVETAILNAMMECKCENGQ